MWGSKFISVSLVILLTFSFQMFCFADDSAGTSTTTTTLPSGTKNIVVKPIEVVTDESKFIKHSNPEKLVAILVDFNDVTIQKEDLWANGIFGETAPSVNTYYKEQSGGKFYFLPADETYGTANDGVIRIKLDSDFPFSGSRSSISQDTVNSIISAAEKYIDLSKFDTDNDGTIKPNELNFLIICAGYKAYAGEKYEFRAYTSDHSIDASTANKKIEGYIISPELSKQSVCKLALEVVCHELGHLISKLPDLYHESKINFADSGTTDYDLHYESLMSSGNGMDGLPTGMDAWCKSMAGFISPIVVDKSGEYELYCVSSGKFNVYKIPTSNSKEYFLIENRQFESYDKGLERRANIIGKTTGQKGGIAIWHINLCKTNTIDNNNKLVDFEEVDDFSEVSQHTITSLKTDEVGRDFFDKDDVFGTDTVPNSNLSDGTSTGIKITVLSDSDSAMKVKIELNSTGSSDTSTETKTQYTVTTNYTGASSEIASTSQTVDSDGSATITVPAVDGYQVESVNNGETAVQASADGSYVINNVKADATVTVTYKKMQYTVTTNYTGASSEIASASQAVDYDGSATITVPAVDGYEVESVKNSETAVQASADGSYVINNVKADATVTVTYKKVQYTVTTNYTGASSEIASTSQAVDYDGSATITVPAVDGYKVDSVMNGETAAQASADGSYVINNVKADATVTVTYKKNTENTNNNANIPQPVKPQPVKPQPVKPQPVKPQPVKPQPVNPQPVKPQPVNPQPVKPQPVKPQPVKPQPVKPQPVKPQPVKPQPIIPQLSLPNIAIQHPIITLK